MIAGLKKLFNESAADLRKLHKLVNLVNQRESEFERYSDAQLRNMTDVFKEKLQSGMKLDDIKIDAFAVVREAAKRVLGLRHYDVQLIGGFVLAGGNIAQMNTGEGKTLVATLPSYLYALEGKGVHIITANEYLARRDKESMGKIHEFLGLKVGLNISQMEPEEKRLAYEADITYGTGTEFGFDYLRDHMVTDIDEKVQRDLYFAIVDEVDSILIDEARTPLIIANTSTEGAELYEIVAMIMREFKKDTDYKVTELKETFLTDEGAAKMEDAFGIENIYDAEHQELLHAVTQALRAHAVMKHDVDYIVKDGKIELIDPFTGRIMEGRSFSEGLHQAIEAKEQIEITPENETFATITVQNYFIMYQTLAGMTGSAMPSRQEFHETYRLKVVEIPTNKPVQRIDHPDVVFTTYDAKAKYIAAEVKRMNEQGRPVLIGTTSIEQSEKLSRYLKREKIKHGILNAKTEEDEARLIAQAGRKGHVMIATNMAGRGTDILLQEGVAELGGLHIIGTERHDSNRIDMQLRGRAGRQGDPGSSQFIISLEDDLFLHYDDEELDRYRKKMKTDPSGRILSPDPIQFVKKVQQIVDGRHYSARVHLLKMESVIDRQSKVVYRMRDQILEKTPQEIVEEALEYLQSSLEQMTDFHFPAGSIGVPKALMEELFNIFPESDWDLKHFKDCEREDFEQLISEKFTQFRDAVNLLKDEEELADELRHSMLVEIDTNWVQHLEFMNRMKDGAGLQGYGQEDPYRHFEMAGYEAFQYLLYTIQRDIGRDLVQYVQERFDEEEDADEPEFDAGFDETEEE